jgi:hypothetical protein
MSFINNYTHHATMYFIHKKSEVITMFKLFHNTIMLPTAQMHTLQSDNSGKYTGAEFKDLWCRLSIDFKPAPPYTPQYNGIAERFNHTIVEMAHTMIINSGMAPTFWAEAIAHAVDTNNHLPTHANSNHSPFQVLHSQGPHLSKLHPFGTRCFLLRQGTKLPKLTPRSLKVCYLGTQDNTDIYRLWVPASHTITTSWSVTFTQAHNPVQLTVLSDDKDKVNTITQPVVLQAAAPQSLDKS